ncbi:pentatricopeptide repeat-containing protein At2g36980, mitochondrial-like [Prosopis cineraria]|uniref:pentatricopeptide repeat-containing protein At2g36980, mitochondrial-like n=1 Tax=Prosopis cineraria TaxID=364024 RepID=UPI002410803A|nr:pentatricopeptide repeat-containing protein At2g36980, mitochondrial-like [Prosopis cineraria]
MRSDLLFKTTSVVVGLARSGRISHARKLFDEMPIRDSVAWNAMISGYSQLGLYHEALSLFGDMRVSHSRPDNFSFSATLNACAGACHLQTGTRIHAMIVVSGYSCYLPVCNSLIDMYGKCSSPDHASKVFHEMSYRNEVTWCSLLFACANSGLFSMANDLFHRMPIRVEIAWNIMIVGYAQGGKVEACLDMFKKMCESLYLPDQCTFSALMNACAGLSDTLYGCMIHSFIIKSGWTSAVEVRNSILSFYSKLGCHDDVIKVLRSFEVGVFNQVSWNAIIDAHMKMGNTQEAVLAFQKAPERNIVSWTSMIAGYTRNGDGEQALHMFADMVRESIQLDDLVAGAVLHACASLALLEHGKMIHSRVIQSGLHNYVYVDNSLVNMYAKCGDIESSRLAFYSIVEKDLISWNTMLFALGLHGRASEALYIYQEMVASGVKPDEVTFIGILMTCSHMGLIDQGLKFFESMRLDYGLPHGIDHVACIIDMLGRSGYVAEARNIADKYSKTITERTNSQEVLLGACYFHGDIGTGGVVGEDLKKLEPLKDDAYVLLSNLYSASGKWKEAERLRKEMVDQRVKKVPGSSWIEVKNKVAAFVSGNNSHPQMGDICKIVYLLELEMRHPCPVHFYFIGHSLCGYM